ncbi:MAG TPA: LeuA family protein [Thermoanaerobaculia bacterium]|nr:LeuA family protein [Thermoanaerobaculia bacterium]
MPELSENQLIHDWNVDGGAPKTARPVVELNDETLRDGLQSPSVRTPSIEQKLEILHLLADIGIDSLDIGLPGAGPHVQKDVERLAREIVEQKMSLFPNCAARTLEADIRPVAEISQRVGIAIEAACFLGSSPIRQYAEGWEMDRMLKLVHDAVSFAVGEGLPVMFVTEDTTRARPQDLERLYTEAVEAGARRVCVADTVGHATPQGVRALVSFIRKVVDATGEKVAVDWHGHNDRGLGVVNCFAAAEAGADRIHGTILGIGERVGNAQLDQILVNFELLGWSRRNVAPLARLGKLVSDATGVPIPDTYPVIGKDAFRTQTGVHAAAILKAKAKGDAWLANRIYSGIPAEMVGRKQEIEVGPMSGQANVVYWLQDHGIEPADELVQEIFAAGKQSASTLAEAEILEICRRHGADA